MKICTVSLTYVTFEHNIKCLWQHPATRNHLDITKKEWSRVLGPIVLTALSLKNLHPRTWKIPIKPGNEELTNLLSASQEFENFPDFKNTHPLTTYLVKKLIRQYQSLFPDKQTSGQKGNKTSYN